jgi:hypothetical protein
MDIKLVDIFKGVELTDGFAKEQKCEITEKSWMAASRWKNAAKYPWSALA